jgi:hypothetical protein
VGSPVTEPGPCSQDATSRLSTMIGAYPRPQRDRPGSPQGS